MVNEVFNFLCSALVVFLLVEVAALVFVSVHESFSRKRDQLRKYYKSRRDQEKHE